MKKVNSELQRINNALGAISLLIHLMDKVDMKGKLSFEEINELGNKFIKDNY